MVKKINFEFLKNHIYSMTIRSIDLEKIEKIKRQYVYFHTT
jgi:hypothetical protein